MRRIVTADIGGTHARFAFATIDGGCVAAVEDPLILKTGEHPSFESAAEEFGRQSGAPLPRELAIAFAGPVGGAVLKLTNNPWVVRPADLQDRLAVERFTLVNDFGAVGHAVARLGPDHFRNLCGPDVPLPEDGVITILGPGTGLRVAALLRRRDGSYEVIETEGGHVDFAPLDGVEDRILQELRGRFRRVSVERLVSGGGLRQLYEALAAIEGCCPTLIDDEKRLWTAAMEGSDSLAAAALERLCLILGAIAGDMALAQGAVGVVIAGGLGLRLADYLPSSGFRGRFIAKGRFERRMDEMPVKLMTHPQPGLFGAAAAFAREHG